MRWRNTFEVSFFSFFPLYAFLFSAAPRCLPEFLLSLVELLDPNWKEQKAKADARFATTNFSTVDVASNLKRLASQRSDVFDNADAGGRADSSTAEDVARRKMAAVAGPGAQPEPRPVGVPLPPVPVIAPGPQVQPLNVDEQIRAIHQKFAK